MPDLYTVREYAFISVAYNGCPASTIDHAYIPETAFDHLCALSALFSENGAKVFELAGRRKLKLDQYVGVIETKCGTRIEILPKHLDVDGDAANAEDIIQHSRRLLQNMLCVSLHLPDRAVGAADLNRFKQPLHEWIMIQFLTCFEKLIQGGLRFDYNRVEDEQKYLKGQLQQAKYMRQPPAKKHIFPIDHDVYEVNRAENRLIKTALDIVCRKTKNARYWKLAQELRLMTGEIPNSLNIIQDFKKWQSGRLLALYAEIKPWTELILSEYMPVSTKGNWRGMSLLFPMERLFEHFVAYHLRHKLTDWDIQTQVSSQYVCTHKDKPMFKLKPDIHISHRETGKKIVLDTKWKLLNKDEHRYGIKDTDIQQMFAYSHYYLEHQSDVILVYPYRERYFAEALSEFDFNGLGGQAKLKVIPFNLDQLDNQPFFDYINVLDAMPSNDHVISEQVNSKTG